MNIINESGLYSLVLRSRKPNAKAFKRWVTHEVLPSIRKTGSYSKEPLSEIQLLQRAVNALAEQERMQKEQAKLQEEQGRLLSAVDSRVLVIEQRHDEILAEIKASPLSTGSLPELTTRRKCVECVNDYSRITTMSQQVIWSSIYKSLYYHYGINLNARKRSNESLIEVAERIGCIDCVYTIITDMLKRIK